ncbi:MULTISPECIES: flagellar export chaperone FliS [unclassified Rummeliibacillus]|uniref:flagellar export chaperone FliS n=1 Tax=unclassified Rummeliibacillus TaxID=2622809 RepID=UPI000E66961C|nr:MULTISPECIES: flagellar export chaperone FliS [unclassified Rummeliibacillus]RIJ65057.1 flagella export chaperone FliS [Rummeliibacillus sp. POC4]RPJ96833.1 flagella export chaperone FliS [Rummeliibacillus sp. TYF005]
MSVQNAYNAYKQNSVTTASPGELTLMLYNGCIKFIHQGKKAIEAKDIQNRNKYIQKAQAIISELMATLNMDIAISKEMFNLYEYMHRRLTEANIQSDTAILDEVEGLVIEFRDTWKQVIQINRQKQFSGDHV